MLIELWNRKYKMGELIPYNLPKKNSIILIHLFSFLTRFLIDGEESY